jgi:hypothetical protein
MLVSVTGGISLVLGGLCAEDAGAEVCGSKPVLTIGGWRSVEMAIAISPLALLLPAVNVEALTHHSGSHPSRY